MLLLALKFCLISISKALMSSAKSLYSISWISVYWVTTSWYSLRDPSPRGFWRASVKLSVAGPCPKKGSDTPEIWLATPVTLRMIGYLPGERRDLSSSQQVCANYVSGLNSKTEKVFNQLWFQMSLSKEGRTIKEDVHIWPHRPSLEAGLQSQQPPLNSTTTLQSQWWVLIKTDVQPGRPQKLVG